MFTSKNDPQPSDALAEKLKKARAVLEDAYAKFGDRMSIFWTGGKDSTVLLHIARSVFGTELKFPILYLNTQLDFQEVYDFIDRYDKEWGLNLITVKTTPEMMQEYNALPTQKDRVVMASMFKIDLLKKAVQEYSLPALVIGIRRDEHPERINEQYLSPREDHVRVHPLLDFTEKDIWDYTHEHNVPYISLYDKGYRSLGEKEFTEPVKEGEHERAGRHREREVIMERLRRLGYF